MRANPSNITRNNTSTTADRVGRDARPPTQMYSELGVGDRFESAHLAYARPSPEGRSCAARVVRALGVLGRRNLLQLQAVM